MEKRRGREGEGREGGREGGEGRGGREGREGRERGKAGRGVHVYSSILLKNEIARERCRDREKGGEL